MSSIPEDGHLEDRDLPTLLLELLRGRFDGALELSRERTRKTFVFQEGAPVSSESTLASESLAAQLLELGRISADDHARVVSHSGRHQCPEAKSLLALRVLEPRQLFDAMKEQLSARLTECFSWPGGRFHVDAAVPPPPNAAAFRSDLIPTVQAGIAAHWSRDRVLTDLMPHMEEHPRPNKRFTGIAARLVSDPSVESVIEAFDGSHTLWQVLQHASTPVALAGAWILNASGALDHHATAECDGTAPPLPLPDRDIEIYIEEGPAEGYQAVRSTAGPKRLPRKLRERAKTLRREIAEKHARLRELDGYALLGVPRDADAATLRRAYLQAAKSFHPDALTRLGLDAEVREQANDVFAAIGKAHAALSDVRSRREYDASLSIDGAELDAERIAQAEISFRKGEILIKTGNFRGALDFLRPAVELWPEECAYQSALGWALFKKEPSEPEAAREYLEKALHLDPKDATNLVRLSAVLRSLGEEQAANAAAGRAQQIDPTAAA